MKTPIKDLIRVGDIFLYLPGNHYLKYRLIELGESHVKIDELGPNETSSGIPFSHELIDLVRSFKLVRSRAESFPHICVMNINLGINMGLEDDIKNLMVELEI